MRINQYNVAVMELEIEDEEEFLQFVKPKLPLMKDYLLNLKGNVTKKIEQFLEINKIQYTKNIEFDNLKRVKKTEQKIGVDVYDRIIRSGEEIETKNSVLCLKKVNDGSRIKTSANFIGIDRVDGTIETTGNFIIFEKGPKSKIIFHGHLLDNFINGAMYKVSYENEEIIIEKVKD